MASSRLAIVAHAAAVVVVVLACTQLGSVSAQQRSCCQPGQACWPSANEFKALEAALDPGQPRRLFWDGYGRPYPLSFPLGGDQPLFGAGDSLAPLYTQNVTAGDDQCDRRPAKLTTYCKLSARNNPMNDWSPAVIAWPTTSAHVQTLVQFAARHNLCVCVAGTGHDFLNRHSCPRGLLIRTALFKDIDWDLEDRRGFGHAPGNVRFGAGIVFHEAHEAAAKQNRVIASGWSPTVGIAGWTFGGGHGPLNPGLGLGVDQLLEAEMVTADGSLVTASSKGTRIVHVNGTVEQTDTNDLWWALRGGGGSTWGVVTSMTVKAHAIPPGGFTLATISWAGDMCAGRAQLHTILDGYLAWAAALPASWGGLVFTQPQLSTASPPPACGATWYFTGLYWYQGGQTDDEFVTRWSQLVGVAEGANVTVDTYATIWTLFRTLSPEVILTLDYLSPSNTSLGGLPSVLVGRERVVSGELGAVLKARMDDCLTRSLCHRQELYNDLTGQLGSPQDAAVSVSGGMRTALFHMLSVGWPPELFADYYALGAHSYFSESAYEMPDWRVRLWGDQYARLEAIKRQVDPAALFGCRHCVGDTDAAAITAA